MQNFATPLAVFVGALIIATAVYLRPQPRFLPVVMGPGDALYFVDTTTGKTISHADYLNQH